MSGRHQQKPQTKSMPIDDLADQLDYLHVSTTNPSDPPLEFTHQSAQRTWSNADSNRHHSSNPSPQPQQTGQQNNQQTGPQPLLQLMHQPQGVQGEWDWVVWCLKGLKFFVSSLRKGRSLNLVFMFYHKFVEWFDGRFFVLDIWGLEL
jgi:hypothetical protein